MTENEYKKYIPSQRDLYGVVFQAYKELGGSATNKEMNDKVAEKVIEKLTVELKDSNETDEKIEEIIDKVITIPRKNDYRTELKYHVAWVQQALKHAGVLRNPKRGTWEITSEYSDKTSIDTKVTDDIEKNESKITEEVAEEQANNLAAVIYDKVTATEFEHLVGYWLQKRGFSNVKITGKPNDKGIDGFATLEINTSTITTPFTFNVAFQCKHYKSKGQKETTVSSNEIREFKGSLLRHDVDRGIFVTTSVFTRNSKEEAEYEQKIKDKIILIDGEQLIKELIECEIGVKDIEKNFIYNVDETFFKEKLFMFDKTVNKKA